MVTFAKTILRRFSITVTSHAECLYLQLAWLLGKKKKNRKNSNEKNIVTTRTTWRTKERWTDLKELVEVDGIVLFVFRKCKIMLICS